VETKTGKIRVAKIKRRRGKRGSRKETRGKEREKTEKETEERTVRIDAHIEDLRLCSRYAGRRRCICCQGRKEKRCTSSSMNN